MTREEERKQEAKKQCSFNVKGINGWVETIDNDRYQGFVLGAKWADRTIIRKAVEWLLHNVNNYIINDKTKFGVDWLKVKAELFDNFKKAMEE